MTIFALILILFVSELGFGQDSMSKEEIEEIEEKERERKEKEQSKKAGQILGSFRVKKKKKIREKKIQADKPENVREKCLTFIGGRLVSLKNDINANSYHLQSHDKEIKKLRAAEKEAKKGYQAAKNIYMQKEYDLDSIEKERNAFYRLDLIQNQIRESLMAASKLKMQLKRDKAFFKEIIKRSKAVFNITYEQIDDGMESIILEYKFQCSKYRFICPLPKSQALAIKQILPGEDPERSCHRYSQVLDPKAVKDRYLQSKARR